VEFRKVCTSYGVEPAIGVIPGNLEENAEAELADFQCSIGIHGLYHLEDEWNVNYRSARKKIILAKQIFISKFGIEPNFFCPPNNQMSRQAFLAVAHSGIRKISGIHYRPQKSLKECNFIPLSIELPRPNINNDYKSYLRVIIQNIIDEQKTDAVVGIGTHHRYWNQVSDLDSLKYCLDTLFACGFKYDQILTN
jgi:predicted deacetylase